MNVPSFTPAPKYNDKDGDFAETIQNGIQIDNVDGDNGDTFNLIEDNQAEVIDLKGRTKSNNN